MTKTDDKNARAAAIEDAVRKADAAGDEEGGKLDKILAGLDSFSGRFDKLEGRMDALETQPLPAAAKEHGSKDDAKEIKQPGKAVSTVADGDDEDEDMDDKERSSLLAEAQERCDSVASAFGESAKPPMSGERPLDYRRRLLRPFQRHSKQFAKADLDAVKDPTLLAGIEASVYADALAAAGRPESYTSGELREVKRKDAAGRVISTFYGNRSFIREFAAPSRRVKSIRNAE